MKRFNQALWIFHMIIGGTAVPFFVYAWGRMSADPIAAPLFGTGILAALVIVFCAANLLSKEA